MRLGLGTEWPVSLCPNEAMGPGFLPGHGSIKKFSKQEPIWIESVGADATNRRFRREDSLGAKRR